MDSKPSTEKVVTYTRISTDKQTPTSQLSELRDYCVRREWKNVEEVMDVVSSTKSSREGLDRLMVAVRRGKVDTVVCFKLDRLGRSLAHLAQIIGEFAAHNVALAVPS